MFFRPKSVVESDTFYLTTLLDLNALKQIAMTYDEYKRHENWIKNRNGIMDGFQGGLYIDHCYDPKKWELTYRILMLIANDVWRLEESEDKKNAVKVCEMFQTLYDHDAKFRSCINHAIKRGDSDISVKYLESKRLDLKAVLTSIASFDPQVRIIREIKQDRKDKAAAHHSKLNI